MLGREQFKLLVKEMDFWRRAGRKSRLDKVRNSGFREMTDVKNVTD